MGSIKIPEDESGLEAFALIMDINSFTLLVKEYKDISIAQFTRDVLGGGIGVIESHGGQVVGLMGDAFYALLADAHSVIESCIAIATDVAKQREYLEYLRSDLNIDEYPVDVGVKIAVEHGWLDVADIATNAMGKQRLFVGDAVIYADRIGRAGRGNRCLFGPEAARMVREEGYGLQGPYRIKGKRGEPKYTYYRMDLSDVWSEAPGRQNASTK